MSLENSPGEPVVFVSRVDAVVGEVTTEVDGTTEFEDIEVIAGCGTFVQHSGGKTGG